MLKRLIIAVFGIGLIIAIGSTAFAGPGVPGNPGNDNAPDVINPNAPRYGTALDNARPAEPSFKKPASAKKVLPPGTQNPGTPSLIYFCDLQDYSGGIAYYWTIPDAFGDDLFNTRFTADPGFYCTLKVAHILMYEPPTAGTPGMRVYLWADDGFGFPGAVLDSVDFTNGDITTAYAPAGNLTYLSADFSAAGWVFSDGDEYHYGWTVLGGAGDTLANISDDGFGPYAGEARSSEYSGGLWGTMLSDWGGGVEDYTFVILSERCCSEIPFSDCYVQSYATNIAFFWRVPHQTYGDEEFAMRFDVGGPETLSSVDFYVYNAGGVIDPAGNNDIYVKIYEDDGFGLPGTLITSATLLAGSYSFFPSVTSVPFAPLVLENTFHVAIRTNGTWDGLPGTAVGDTWEAILSSDGTDGVGRSSSYWVGGPWVDMLSGWGVDYNFLIDVYMCRDEFSDCSVQNWTGGIVDDSRAIPDGNPALLWAQKFFNSPGGSDCELRQVTLHFVRLAADITAGRDSMYTYNTDIQIKTDNAGYPNGALLHQVTLTPADYAAAGFTGPAYTGNFFITLNLAVSIPANFWVVVDPQAPDRARGIRHASNLFTGGGGNVDGMATLYGVDSLYYTVFEFFGTPDDGALDIEADVCCVPFAGRTCLPGDVNWAARSHDQARSGASLLGIGDAWCDLNLNWYADELVAAQTAETMGPIVYNNRVYQIIEGTAAGSIIRVFNLVTGTLEQTLSGVNLGNFAENDPLLISDKLYVCGGDNRVISRYDVSVPGAAVLDWTRTLGGAVGPLRRANLLLVDVGGTDVLYGGSQLGRVFAINEADGLDYPGWATNPLILNSGQLVAASATDGSQLYFGTRQAGLSGNVWALNPATGAVNWDLVSDAGLSALDVYASVTSEGFSVLSVEGSTVYTASIALGNFPTDGVFYRLDAGTGAGLSAAATTQPRVANPIIDVNLVYLPTFQFWSAPNVGSFTGQIFAFDKGTGAISWNSEQYFENSVFDRCYNNALLTCEPEPQEDIIVMGNRAGYLRFVNSLTGAELFSRRIDFGIPINSLAGAVAIGEDSLGEVHLLSGSVRGALFDLTKGPDRPRLEIRDYDPVLAVEFSVSVSEIYSVPDVITNTGCADLTFSAVNVDTATFGSTDPGVSPFTPFRPDLMNAATLLANDMAANSQKFKSVHEVSNLDEPGFNNLMTSSEENFRSERGYRAASVLPAYLNGVIEPFGGQVVGAGDSIPLTLDVNPSMINRGPQTFYIELQTDDPDFFLNVGSVTLPNDYPELIVTLVGGCLGDTTRLIFGVGSSDFQLVSNTTRLADSDWPETGFQYNGSPLTNTPIFQGTYIFGVSTERIAMNVKNWFGQAEENSWFSVQADPNYCDNDCKPALMTGVALGSLWNGASYDPITGNMICKSWVDSVQDYALGGPLANWDWRNYGAPFSDSLSIGVSANTRTVGVEGVAEFDNISLEIFEVSNRSASDSIKGWKFASNIDYDASHFYHSLGKDTLIFDQSISASWTTSQSNPAVDYAYGLVKLPFGCGHDPMVSTMGLDADQGHYDDVGGRGDPYFDSAYFYMSLAPGTERSHSISAAAQDEQSHSTLVWKDFAPSETITFAAALFGLDEGVSAPHANGGGGEISAIANFTNKWVGFGRGDVNDDNAINLGDIMTLADIVGGSTPGAIPFEHLADVDADGDVDNADLNYLINYYFGCGPCPIGDWIF